MLQATFSGLVLLWGWRYPNVESILLDDPGIVIFERLEAESQAGHWSYELYRRVE